MRLFRRSLLIVILAFVIWAEAAEPSVLDEIRVEATRSNNDSIGRPLPLAAHWKVDSAGLTPDDQVDMIQEGHHILPTFGLPDPGQEEYYAENAIKRAARMNLPIAFVSTQWDSVLSNEPYISIDAVNGVFSGDRAAESTNPNVIASDDSVLREVSPFGPPGQIDLWREVSGKWATSPALKNIQSWYPDPPLSVFISNNEHRKLFWKEAENSKRYIEMYIDEGKEAGMDAETRDDFRRRVFGDGWIERYNALLEGFRSGLVGQRWREKSIFAGYEAFGPPLFNCLDNWPDYSFTTTYTYTHDPQPDTVPRIDPWHFAWDGTTSSFYVSKLDKDYISCSPQIRAMNWLFMREETYQFNPEFWFEMIVWDGYDPRNEDYDKRRIYEELGQTFTPERYGGMVQFGMWLLRPRVVREFRFSYQTKDDILPYYIPIVEAVDRVYRNPILQSFWRAGELVANPVGQNPYQRGILDGYSDQQIEERYGIGRWFLLSSDLNPELPPNGDCTEIPVFSLALVMGEFPERQWLVYAHSPLEDRTGVEITIPEYKAIVVDVSVGGSFYLVDESESTVTLVTEQPPVVLQDQIKFKKGWNLISLSLIPENKSILHILGPILGSCDSVWTYNGFTKNWRRYLANDPNSPNDLTEMEPGYGYLINMTHEETLVITGYKIVYASVPLDEGWNLVGYSSLDPQTPEHALSSIDGIHYSVLTYDSTTKSWLRYMIDSQDFPSNLGTMEPWRGYWINVADGCIWDMEAHCAY